MMFSFDVAYYAKAALKERDILSSREFSRPVEVEIEQISGEMAPVAASWGEVEIRLYEGRAFRRVFMTVTAAGTPEFYKLNQQGRRFDHDYGHRFLEIDEIAYRLANDDHVEFLHTGYFMLAGDRKKGFKPSRFHRYEYTEEAQARDEAHLERWRKDCLVIDGQFWVKCPDPAFHITDRGEVYPTTLRYDATKRGALARGFRAEYRPLANALQFPPDGLEDAIMLCSDLNGRADIRKMKLHIPGAFCGKSERTRLDAVRELVSTRFGFIAGRNYRTMEPRLLRAFADLRELPERGFDEDQMVDVLRELLSALPEGAIGSKSTIIANAALERASNRPVDLHIEL